MSLGISQLAHDSGCGVKPEPIGIYVRHDFSRIDVQD